MDNKCSFCGPEFNQLKKSWCEKYCDQVKQNSKTLRIFAKWRKGADIEMPEPKAIGKALEMVNELLK